MVPEIRLATVADIPAIYALEEEAFGEVGEDGQASTELIKHRIRLLNETQPGWFWVACVGDDVVGDVVVQPTNLSPDECTSWDIATDNGNLTGTFDPEGMNLYGVSVAVSGRAPVATVPLLMHQMLVLRALTSRRHFMFCARMPGFQQEHEQTGISAEEYWRKVGEDGKPHDPMLARFVEMFGEHPERLLPDGYLPDKDSGGHGVLFATSDPLRGLESIAACILRDALSALDNSEDSNGGA